MGLGRGPDFRRGTWSRPVPGRYSYCFHICLHFFFVVFPPGFPVHEFHILCGFGSVAIYSAHSIFIFISNRCTGSICIDDATDPARKRLTGIFQKTKLINHQSVVDYNHKLFLYSNNFAKIGSWISTPFFLMEFYPNYLHIQIQSKNTIS